jgi:hypothetical protein
MGDWSEDVRRIIGILGIPRSGTTLVAAAFSTAPDVAIVYEPFNDDEGQHWREGTMTLDRFARDCQLESAGRSALVIKETSTKFEYIDLMRQVFESAESRLDRRLLVTLRNPLHCFLSEVQARREWWGDPDLEISTPLFDNWAKRTIRSLKRMLDLLQDVGGFCVSYSRLVRSPDELTGILESVGVTASGDEPTFYERFEPSVVHGDISLATNPRPLSTASEKHRTEELETVIEKLSPSERFDSLKEIVTTIDQLSASVAIPSTDERVREFHSLLNELAANQTIGGARSI